MTSFPASRRLILFAGLACATLVAAPSRADPDNGGLSPEDKALTDQAAAYLQGLAEAKGRFEQTDPHGVVSHGDLYLSRPGRARFAYDPPSSLLVVSDGRKVWVTDPRLRTVTSYPLKSTPLALFLADEVRFDRGVVVDRVERFDGGFTLYARDGHHWSQGRLELSFATGPMRLTQWSLTDPRGATTQVRLTEFTETSGLDPALFDARGAAPAAEGEP